MNLKTILKNPVIKFSLSYLLFNFIFLGGIYLLKIILIPEDAQGIDLLGPDFLFIISILYSLGFFNIIFFFAFINKIFINYDKTILKFIIVFLAIYLHSYFHFINSMNKTAIILKHSFLLSLFYYAEFLIVYFRKK
ncbi:hypothetical protein [Miniphocaeibacter massiliensis]|uniref:hypothetical protein n=1 Tax=Miniphocaeibacter massiliensis TaxID=2041841 RepID=UPI000C1C38B1|nr:hypothetical protein [Miniphocaeibacter massiliensis]